MAAPIPLYCHDNAGSGFLVTDGTIVWLVTCVHIITGLLRTPPKESLFTAAQIHVAGEAGALPLFVDGQRRFTVVTNTTTGCLIDAVALRLMPHEIAGVIGFGKYEIGSITRAEVGDTVTARGFPSIDQMLKSRTATFNPSELKSEVVEIEGVSIRLSDPGAGGFSGGPVANDQGLIGIMHGDKGDSTNLTSALVISLDVIADNLFL